MSRQGNAEERLKMGAFTYKPKPLLGPKHTPCGRLNPGARVESGTEGVFDSSKRKEGPMTRRMRTGGKRPNHKHRGVG